LSDRKFCFYDCASRRRVGALYQAHLPTNLRRHGVAVALYFLYRDTNVGSGPKSSRRPAFWVPMAGIDPKLPFTRSIAMPAHAPK
jgi:hypothetical protein